MCRFQEMISTKKGAVSGSNHSHSRIEKGVNADIDTDTDVKVREGQIVESVPRCPCWDPCRIVISQSRCAWYEV